MYVDTLPENSWKVTATESDSLPLRKLKKDAANFHLKLSPLFDAIENTVTATFLIVFGDYFFKATC